MDRGGRLVAGRFEFYDLIGRGATGSVWRAYDRKHGDVVAAKQLTHTDAATVLRFVREQSLRIRHPHVVAPSGWAADDEHVVLRMDLVRGGSLQTLLGDHGALPTAYVAELLDQLLDALTAVHATGVVHRDLKPANLLLDVTGQGRPWVRVSDFGIAAVLDEPRLTERAGSLGTAGFMAPEQALGAEPEPRHDLYAVGVLGKVLLTGGPPRTSPERHRDPLWPWLDWLADPDPRQRPVSAAQARSELARVGVSGLPWPTGEDAPEVFDQLGPDPVRPREKYAGPLDPPSEAAQPAFRGSDGAGVARPSPERSPLRLVAIGAFAGSALLLVVALVLLLR